MKVYSVVGQWTDNSMAIPKHPKRDLAQFRSFDDAKKFRDQLRAINDESVLFCIMENDMDISYLESMKILFAFDCPIKLPQSEISQK